MLRTVHACALVALVSATSGCMLEDANGDAIELTAAQCASARAWSTNVSYATGAIVTYEGQFYQCLQGHTSLEGWTPKVTAALWQRGTCGSPTGRDAATSNDASAPRDSSTPQQDASTGTCNRNAWNYMGNNDRACEGHLGEPCGWTTTNLNQGYTCKRESWGVACSAGGAVCPGGSTPVDASTPPDASRDASVADASRPDAGGLVWRSANLTNFESYPDPGSDECIRFNGCTWAGMFAAVNGTQPLSWVMSHNIAAIHSRDFAQYRLKTLRLRQGTRSIDVTVYDMCADTDCNGCCTQNAQQNGLNFLIDIEKYTMGRFGSGSGIVEWTCLDC